MYTVVGTVMQLTRLGMTGLEVSSQTPQSISHSGVTHTSARSRRAVARVVGLLVLLSMPQLGSCAQMHGSRLQLSKHLSKTRVGGHSKQHVAFTMESEESAESVNKMAQQMTSLLQVSEDDHEETQTINKTATQAPWPWIQRGVITKKKDATAPHKRVGSDSPPAVAAPEATSGFEIQNFHESEVSQASDVAKVVAPVPDPSVSSGFQVATSDTSEIPDQNIDITDSGSHEKVLRGLAAIQQQLPSMMIKINGGQSIALPAFIAAAIFATVMLLWFWASVRSSKATGPRSIVESLKLSYGAQVENLLQAKDRYDSVMQTPLSQGNVMRVQGRVVQGSHGHLTSPLWQRESVMYSASVTPKISNGKYGKPITVHSRSVDFAIQLLDAPHIQLAVCGQDAMLFDMNRGIYEKDLTLADAGENWQDFVLDHAGAEHTSAAFESDDLMFQFREVALSLGAVVTCVGEVRRDQYGVLGLWPWQSKKGGIAKVAKDAGADVFDPFGSDLEKVLISDDSSLFPKSSKHTIPWDCCADAEDEAESDAVHRPAM